MITIVDYGMGNVGSIRNMLRSCGAESTVTADHGEIRSAKKLILPGVGAFDAGMKSLSERGLVEPLTEAALDKKIPVLGICLGMQLMCRSSQEGKLPGLGWFDAEVRHFDLPNDGPYKIPHMGWNTLALTQETPLFEGCVGEQRFYFVHSYHVASADPKQVAATSHHGYEFAAALRNQSIFGVQFHPEKSHRFGMSVMKKFAAFPC